MNPVVDGRRPSIPIDESFDFELHGFDPKVAFSEEGLLLGREGGSETDEELDEFGSFVISDMDVAVD